MPAMIKLLTVVAAGLVVAMLLDGTARAQPPAPDRGAFGAAAVIVLVQDSQKDCQTVRTCRFDRQGPYRGCLSSYTCRVCKFVPATCRTEAGVRRCQEMRCSWGG